ncbi:MAG: hypothetical protein C0618_11490 [Desulfuromonas sp.]|nr:MAG: hypothetical protein C0618_11490 [Desulfuromonas sp.]
MRKTGDSGAPKLQIGLKVKMALAVTALLAVFLIGIGYLFSTFFQNELKRSIAQQNYTIVTTLAREVDNLVRSVGAHIEGMARVMDGYQEITPERAETLLKAQRDDLTQFDNDLYLYSPDLTLLATARGAALDCGSDCPHEQYLKTTLLTRSSQVSEPFFSGQTSPRPIMMFTSPVLSADGDVIAVLAGTVDLMNRNFIRRLLDVKLGEAGYLYLYNQQRMLVFHPNHARILKKDVPLGVNLMFDRALNGFEGTGETVTSFGLEALSSFKRLETNDWILAANYPLAEAHAPIVEAREKFFMVLVNMLLVAACVAWMLMRRMTFPLEQLTKQIRDVEISDAAVQIRVDSEDEIGELARAFSGLLQRISEKEMALTEQIHFLQVLIDVMPNPVFFKDVDGVYTGCNNAFEDYIGITKQNLLGKSVFEIAPADLAEKYHAADNDLLKRGAGQTQTYESSVQWADGTQHQVIFYKATFVDQHGELAGLVGSILDISERKQIELALEEQKQFSDAILQNAAAPAFVIDAEHRVLIWNRACEELTGMSADTLLGTDQHWMAFYQSRRPCLADLIIDGLQDDFGQYYTKVVPSPLISGGLEAEGWLLLSGRMRYIVFNAAPIHDNQGRVIAVIQTLDDITPRKKAEEEISRSKSLIETTLESTGDGILAVNRAGQVTTYNQCFLEMWQLPADISGQNVQGAVFDQAVAQLENSVAFKNEVTGLYDVPEKELESLIRFRDGRIYEMITRPQLSDKKIIGRVWNFRDMTSQRQSLDELSKLSQALEQSTSLIMITDIHGNIEYVNEMFVRVTGYSRNEMIGENPRILNGGRFPHEYYQTLWETISSGLEWRGEMYNRKKDGTFYWEHVQISPVRNTDGKITNFLAIKEDITAAKFGEQRELLTDQVLKVLSLPGAQINRQRDVLRLIKDFTGMEGAALLMRVKEQFFYQATLGFEEFFGAGNCHPLSDIRDEKGFAESLCGKVFLEQLPAELTDSNGTLWRNDGMSDSEAQLCCYDQCSRLGVRSMALIPLKSGTQVIGLLQLNDCQPGKLSTDLVEFLEKLAVPIALALEQETAETRLQEKEDHLNFLVNYDSLTGLPNRTLFHDRLAHVLDRGRRRDTRMALLLIDLDRFKTINDSIGHDYGDSMLCQVAERLKTTVRSSDTLARLGGDEFGLLLEDEADLENVLLKGQIILEKISEPFDFEGHKIYLTASIGISVCPTDGHDSDVLLKYAEIAMYRAKDQGRNTCQFYHPKMNSRSREILFLEGALRQGLEQDQFVLHYQPQIDLHSNCIVGAEALVRWQHPTMGMVSPADFIPLAEETGLIVPLGSWVMRQACQTAKRWHDEGQTEFRIAVNISARQFNEPGFIDTVDQILQDTGIDPLRLEMEITESVIMDRVDDAIMTLTDLKSRGISLAIDDFGTGYSSLSYLQKFPITHLKIDRAFITDVCTNEQSATLAESVIALAKGMGLQVIAEGVEEQDQREFLLEKDCDEAQGYLFSRPIPERDLEEQFFNNTGAEDR